MNQKEISIAYGKTTKSAHAPAGPTHEENMIVVAHDISPADMLRFKDRLFGGFLARCGKPLKQRRNQMIGAHLRRAIGRVAMGVANVESTAT